MDDSDHIPYKEALSKAREAYRWSVSRRREE